MAGNFLKYGAGKNAGDIPVDSHSLLALCAPRPTFVSYGVPEKGDAKWLDQQGSFMATVAAGPVFRLLGAKDLGVREDYRVARMPAVNTDLLAGQLAWRQHDGGHTDGPNWKYFLPWASRELGYKAPALPVLPAAVAAPRTDANSLVAHARLVEKARAGGIDIYFEGDSITRRWGAADYPLLLANWEKNFAGWRVGVFGGGADRIQNILWRVKNGELDKVNPKVVVLQAGTNNIGSLIPAGGEDLLVADVTSGLRALVEEIRTRAPEATVIVTGIFLRNDNMAAVPVIRAVNRNLARMADGGKVRFLDVNDKLADSQGRLLDGMMNADKLHPAEKGYQVWADGLRPLLRELAGEPGRN
jgi:lysophospholipase L1-like esterase